MHSNSLLLLAIAGVSLIPVTVAQDAAASRRAGPRLDMARGQSAVVEVDGALRAFGRNYKARSTLRCLSARWSPAPAAALQLFRRAAASGFEEIGVEVHGEALQ